MAWVVNPPELVDDSTGAYSRQSVSEINDMYVVVGTYTYAFLQGNNDHTIHAFKKLTADIGDGISWTLLDDSNAPLAQRFSLTSKATSGVIGIVAATYLGSSTPGDLFIKPFDTGSDAWGISTATGPTAAYAFAIYRRSDLTYVVLKSVGLLPTSITWHEYAAGAWGSSGTAVASAAIVQKVLVDASDNGYLLYGAAGGGGRNLSMVKISAAMSVGSPALVNTGVPVGSASDSGRYRSDAIFFDAESKVVVGSVRTNGTVWIGISALSALSFASTQINFTPENNANVTYPTMGLGLDDNPAIFWEDTDYVDSPIFDRIWVSRYDGAAWEDPQLYYDEIDNPPADGVPDQSDQFVHTGQAHQRANGDWVFLVALEIIPGEEVFCTQYVLLGVPPAEELVLACPVGGGTGTLGGTYNKTLVVTGGTSPYTFEVISGQLPPGTTLNTATGNISGILTAVGSYSYTVRVTDSVGETDEATCAVTITGEVPPPPEFCETFPPPSYAPTYVLYDEPTELTGS